MGSAVYFGSRGWNWNWTTELREFLETAIEQKIRTGLSREAAVRAARMELGSVEAVKDRVRDVGWETDARKLLARRTLCTLDAAPSASIYGGRALDSHSEHRTHHDVVHALQRHALRPWSGVADVARAISSLRLCPNLGERVGCPTVPQYRYLAEHARAVAALAASRNETVRLENDRDGATRITDYDRRLLRGAPTGTLERGRSFWTTDDAPGAPQPVAVISADLWLRRFAGDPAIIGGD